MHHWSAICHHYLKARMVHSRECYLGMSCHSMSFSLLNVCFQNVLVGALFHPLWAILLLSVLTTIGSVLATLLCMPLALLLSQLCLWPLEMTRHAIEGGLLYLVCIVSWCHGSTGSPSALLKEVLRGGMTVLEGSKVLARGTRSCT